MDYITVSNATIIKVAQELRTSFNRTTPLASPILWAGVVSLFLACVFFLRLGSTQ